MTTQTNQPRNSGKVVCYKLAVTCVGVSPGRLALRPADKELIDSELDFKTEENALIGGANTDPVFSSQLGDLAVGAIHSWEVDYPPFDADNLIVLPIDFLRANRISDKELEIGMVLNLDILRNKVAINGEAADLEVIDIRESGGKTVAVLDSNDTLRGLTCRYDVRITEIREATVQEVQAGMSLPDQ